ncbi:unnamed protein product [Thlaspi arvense]|uniref:CCR4-NOT transcription complex subunit 1 n=1 Tax=Thlaspi arvense TaxID=13288 RepID=A0AAU9T8F4_THLAR|nr:unnamed protein product [Thlaspi arvense]
MESGPDQPHSVLSIHTGATDGINLHDIQNNTPIASCPSASAPELRNLGTSNITKESGGSSQPLLSISGTQHLGTSTSEPLLSTGDALEKYQIISEKLETLVSSNGKDADIQGLIAEVPRILLRCVSRDEAALAVAQKVFKGLYESSSNSAHVAAHLGILAAIRDVSKFVVKELTSWVIYSDEDRKFNKDITLGLIQSELLNLAEYNVHMAKLLDAGRNKGATEFAISLIRTLLNSDSRVISELHYLVDALAKNPVGNATATFSVSAGKDNNATQIKEKKAPDHSGAGREECNVVESGEMDPAGFYEKVSMLFTDWCRLCELPGANDSAFAHYVLQLQQSGLLKGDNTQDRFFNCIMKFTMSHCLPPEVISSGPLKSPHVQPLSFLAIDIYAKLVISIVRVGQFSSGFSISCQDKMIFSKCLTFLQVLAVAVKFIQKDADERKTSFNPRPYFRLFINWLLDLGSMDSVSDDIQVSTAFANAFHALQPLKVPGFSPQCISPNMRLPDPSTPNLKIDLLTEMSQPPHILSAVDAALRAKQIKGDVDEYLKTRPEESSFLTGLKQRLLLPPDDAARAGTRYNVPLINSLVLYVGTQAIQQLRERTPHAESTANSAPLAVFLVGAALDIFEILMIDLDTEGRYHVLNAIANQLRYPNNHTHYFSFIILYLFGESKQEIIQEQITRVLFERLIANQPHPWGLLIVIIELIKNPTYNFWSHSFTRCAPEIEKIFESVLRSCRGAKPLDESVVTGGVMPDLH